MLSHEHDSRNSFQILALLALDTYHRAKRHHRYTIHLLRELWMWLLNTHTFDLHHVPDPTQERYAILSHTWHLDVGEQSFQVGFILADSFTFV